MKEIPKMPIPIGASTKFKKVYHTEGELTASMKAQDASVRAMTAPIQIVIGILQNTILLPIRYIQCLILFYAENYRNYVVIPFLGTFGAVLTIPSLVLKVVYAKLGIRSLTALWESNGYSNIPFYGKVRLFIFGVTLLYLIIAILLFHIKGHPIKALKKHFFNIYKDYAYKRTYEYAKKQYDEAKAKWVDENDEEKKTERTLASANEALNRPSVLTEAFKKQRREDAFTKEGVFYGLAFVIPDELKHLSQYFLFSGSHTYGDCIKRCEQLIEFFNEIGDTKSASEIETVHQNLLNLEIEA